MKKACLITFLFINIFAVSAQTDSTADTSKRSLKNTIGHNMYGDLLKDDPAFNPGYPWYQVSGRVLVTNAVNWAAAKYIYKVDWTSSGINDWRNAFQKGPEWDNDKFGINFIGHPHTPVADLLL